MEIYDECHLCGKWNDLTIWRKGKGIYVCIPCANRLDTRALKIHERVMDTFTHVKKEMEKESNG